MKGYRKIKQEEEDSRFIAMACENGDPEAIQLISRNQEIYDRIGVLINEAKGKTANETKGILEEMNKLIREKEELFRRFDLERKKPQIYLESLKRKKYQEI